jgi:phosphatidylserine/phosphatidylglycerophosphate/cardiolipin synthase-like enzyme
MNLKRFFVPTISILLPLAQWIATPQADAKIEALFHPHDPTLEKIATWIEEAQSHIDIAMYNMDTTDGSPVIQTLKSESVQKRIRNGELLIRLIFEGYGTSAENAAKMQAIEDLGVDVRFLGRSVKVHHKFAAIDTGLVNERVISGSANWSLSSYRNYNENILFFENEPEANDRFQDEFNRIWQNSKPFGLDHQFPDVAAGARDQRDLVIHFNSPRRLRLVGSESELLTDQVVRLIDSAESTIEIASTRIRLVPVLEAVSAAAERGVKVRILISQDDYRDLHKRASYLEHENIEVRIKFYNLKPGEYLAFQMHNKFMVVDGHTVLTGSFNWSESAEKSHIENLVEIKGRMGKTVGVVFSQEFESLWEMGRDKLGGLKARLAEMKSSGRLPRCAFSPIAMHPAEVRNLLRSHRQCEL